jgi:hypothetical protein
MILQVEGLNCRFYDTLGIIFMYFHSLYTINRLLNGPINIRTI